MSALVSMHGVWFLVSIPLAITLAWRLHGEVMKRVAMIVALIALVGLLGWFGYHIVIGAEFTETIFDRVMHALGVVISYVDLPIVQLLSAAIVAMLWPKSLAWKGARDELSEARSIENPGAAVPVDAFRRE